MTGSRDKNKLTHLNQKKKRASDGARGGKERGNEEGNEGAREGGNSRLDICPP